MSTSGSVTPQKKRMNRRKMARSERDKKASVKIAEGMAKVNDTNNTPITFGNI